MRHVEVCELWAVYSIAVPKQAERRNIVCEQAEWDLIASSRTEPAEKQLIRAGITNEAEAERIARGTSGDAFKAGYRKNAPPRNTRTLPSGRRI